ncbi:MAG TPA: hypothetical protein VK986_05065 [Tepidisphaeraceae bacterium]|nr:hypothetical protein [Tepidisphaeraceae bacterium]
MAIAAWCGGTGCEVAQTRHVVERDAPIRPDDVRVTTEQFRLRMRSLVGPMCGQIERAADDIIATSPDLKVKLAALRWKAEAVPAMREAVFRPDAYSAAFDTAALCMQMIEYFEFGAGREALGSVGADKAAAACRGMLAQFLKVVASATASGDISKARDAVQRWAAEHPIGDSIAARESAMSRVFEQEFSDSRGAFEYIADASATADDLTRRMDVFSDHLFRQARWEVERFQLALVRDYRVDETVPLADRAVKSAERAVTTIDQLTPDVRRTLAVAQDAPKLLVAEREAVLKAMSGEMDRAFKILRDERVLAFEQISKERSTASLEIRDALLAQATQLTGEADRMVTRQIDYVIDKSTRLVQIAMAVAITVVFVVLLLRRRPAPLAR